MSCQEHGCDGKIELFCKECPNITFFCTKHSRNHSQNPPHHAIMYLKDEVLFHIQRLSSKNEIDNQISNFLKYSKKVISVFKQTVQEQISKMKNNPDFYYQRDNEYNIEDFLSILSEEGLIKKGNYLIEDEFSKMRETELSSLVQELQSKLDNKDKEVEDLKSSITIKISELDNQLQDKDRKINSCNLHLENKSMQVEDLISSITMKLSELDNQLQDKDRKIKMCNFTLQNIDEVKKILDSLIEKENNKGKEKEIFARGKSH